MPHKVLQRTYSTRLQRLRARVPPRSRRQLRPVLQPPIECTDRDAPFVLDGVLYHESDLDLEVGCLEQHGTAVGTGLLPVKVATTGLPPSSGNGTRCPFSPFFRPRPTSPRGFPAPTPGGAVAPPGHQGDLFWPVRRARSSAPRDGLRALADSALPGPGDPSAALRRHSRRRSATPPSRPRLLGRRRSWGDAARRDLDGPPRGR